MATKEQNMDPHPPIPVPASVSNKAALLGTGSCLLDLLLSDQPVSLSGSHKKVQADPAGPVGRLEDLLLQPGNKICADCGSADPKWVSINLGVFICIKCSGVHRSLGVHISKVLSVKLDDWTDGQVDVLVDIGGNTAANMKYEAFLPENVQKIKPDSTNEERSNYIRRKYEQQQCLKPDVKPNVQNSSLPPISQVSAVKKNESCCNSNTCAIQENKSLDKQPTAKGLHSLGQTFRNSWRRKGPENKASKKTTSTVESSPGMVEFVGLVKVNVVKGTHLAVRDVLTSDPYVILTLGQQSVKTHVIRSNLNPVWNERLMLAIPEPIPILKLQVYDKDAFKADDFMGEAEIDIQPLVSAAKAYENSTLTESMQLGKWVASKDNTLVRDSIISLEDGKVKQGIVLKLQNVERGVLDIELECLPLTQ